MQLSEYQKYFEPLKEDGFIRFNNFLNDEDKNKVKKIVKFYNLPKTMEGTHFSVNFTSHIIKILKLDIKRLLHSYYLLSLAKKKKMNQMSNLLLENKSYLKMIDGYCSPISDKEVLPWHCDQAYSNAMEVKNFNNPDHFNYKFFIYLTDVRPANGCTSYIKGSHKITYALRKGIFEKKIKYTPYWSLTNLIKTLKIKENYNYVKNYLGSEIELNEFFKCSELAIKNLDNNRFDFNAKAGDVIIFNDGGVHKGSKVLKSERIVLRYLYSTRV